MKRSRRFLLFILILLLINSLFFLFWYGLDGESRIGALIEREAGKALKGEFRIRSFSLSDQQLYAEGISFSARDSTLSFNVESARVRFHLLKFIFSGFKIRNILNETEINHADIAVAYRYKPKPKKPRRRLEIPDLRKSFNELRINDSSFSLDLELPLKLGGEGNLIARERLTGINIRVSNAKVTNLSLQAVSANKGGLKVSGVLDQGRLATAQAEISNYIPLFISHPQIRDFTTELNCVAEVSQKARHAPLDIDLKTIVWNTQAYALQRFPIRVPYFAVTKDGSRLSLDIATSTIGTSTIGGKLGLDGLNKDARIESGGLAARIDLGMILPELQGLIDTRLTATGSISDPRLTLNAGSASLNIFGQEVRNPELAATYEDQQVQFTLSDTGWQNQNFDVSGTFTTSDRKALLEISTTPVSEEREELRLEGKAKAEVTFYTPVPEVKAELLRLDAGRGDLELKTVSGYLNFYPLIQPDERHYYVDVGLDMADNLKVSLVGDLLDRNLLLDGAFHSLALAELLPQKALQNFQPVVSGKIRSFLTQNRLVASSQIDLVTEGLLNYSSSLDLLASYDLGESSGDAIVRSERGKLNGIPLDFELIAGILGSRIDVKSFRLNDKLNLSASSDLQNPEDLSFELFLRNLDSADLQEFFPDLNLPGLDNLSLSASYNPGGAGMISIDAGLEEFQLPGIRPLSAKLSFRGPPEQIVVSGEIGNQFRQLVDINGSMNLSREPNLRLNARSYGLAASDLVYSALAEGLADLDVSFAVTDIFASDRDISLIAQLSSQAFSIPGVVDLDDLQLKLAQTQDILIVDTLSVRSRQYGSVRGSGTLDYNLLTNRFYEGNHSLNLQIEGLLFDWLKRNVDLVTDASGKASLDCNVRMEEEQLVVTSGDLAIQDGRIQLEDQPEAIRDITVNARFDNNRLIINDFTCLSGQGRFTLQNQFDEDDSAHLKFGYLDLGTLSLRIDQPGARVQIPLVTSPRNLSSVVLQGQNSSFATIKGPFEDMRIEGELLVYNAEALFPPKTDNILNLIYSFRGALAKTEMMESDPVPLPLTLDLMIRLMDNIRYATYPTNFLIQPGGYLHLIYDGQRWRLREASFTSEQGTIDFFGTVFQAESLNISIIEAQNLTDIQGSFYRRAADGTLITLSVSTDKDTSKPIFQRLTFSLKSDNPEDRTITNILSRLRYSSSQEELSPTQRGSLLQDEALNLISENLNTSLVDPFLYPLENTIRRWFKLDDFSINAGFIQNLFTEYTTDPSQLAEYADMNQIMSDIAQFSSSILLNNLSFSLSKYLGRRFFLDYSLTLQEATDLQNKTQIVVSHDTTLRWVLPRQFRLNYTFQYEPRDRKMTHELMLQRSFRFWGL